MAPSARLSAQGNVGFAAGGIHSGGHLLTLALAARRPA